MFKDQINATHLLLAADQSGTYDDCHVLMKGYFAAKIIVLIKERGEVFAIGSASDVIGSRNYPDINRKEF